MYNKYDQIEKEIVQEVVNQLQVPRPKNLKELAKVRIASRKLEAQAPSTGYRSLDLCYKGLVPGRLAVLTADTNTGKTTFCANLAYRVARQGFKVLYLALETNENILDLFVSVATQKPTSTLTQEDLLSFTGRELPIETLTGQDFKNFEVVKETIRRSEARLVIVDHVGYLDSVGKVIHEFNANQAKTIRELALLANETGKHILLVAHLNKTFTASPDKWIPSMNQISGSAGFKQDCADVLILARKPISNEYSATEYTSEAVIYVAKTKSPLGRQIAKLNILPGTAYWYDGYETQQQEFFAQQVKEAIL